MKIVWCKTTSSLGMTRRSYVSFLSPLAYVKPAKAVFGRLRTLQQIVALQNNVLALNKKQLKRPTRASLAPGHLPPSHSGIVNSPW